MHHFPLKLAQPKLQAYISPPGNKLCNIQKPSFPSEKNNTRTGPVVSQRNNHGNVRVLSYSCMRFRRWHSHSVACMSCSKGRYACTVSSSSAHPSLCHNSEVQQIRPVLFPRDPIARSVTQIPFGHLPVAVGVQLRTSQGSEVQLQCSGFHLVSAQLDSAVNRLMHKIALISLQREGHGSFSVSGNCTKLSIFR